MTSPHVKVATDANFVSDVLGSDTPALVDFWAEWCGPCRALGPLVDQIAEENQGKIKVFKMNVEATALINEFPIIETMIKNLNLKFDVLSLQVQG